ncbi:MAG: glutathione S-transferase family protein [Proteobacteria bacterium]|nr:glutathione S-transferase family protein [Pseudomonadota bacterium]
MILVGRNHSAYTRRVGIALRALGILYEQLGVSPSKDAEVVRRHNPMGLVPALVLDDGTALIDSAAICDYLDDLVGPARALTPATGAARREVTQTTALALQVLGKCMEAHHEMLRKPKEKQHQPYLDACHERMGRGFALLEGRVPAEAGWLCAGRLSHADIATVVTFDFANLDFPALGWRERFPRLAAYARRMNALPPFAECQPEAG